MSVKKNVILTICIYAIVRVHVEATQQITILSVAIFTNFTNWIIELFSMQQILQECQEQ